MEWVLAGSLLVLIFGAFTAGYVVKAMVLDWRWDRFNEANGLEDGEVSFTASFTPGVGTHVRLLEEPDDGSSAVIRGTD